MSLIITLETHLQLIRMERDEKLKATDWCVLPDSPLSPEKKDEVLLYRTKLRDLPRTITEIEEVTWPTPPII